MATILPLGRGGRRRRERARIRLERAVDIGARTAQAFVERAGRSRDKRRAAYSWYRMWWSHGSATAGPPAKYNKIMSHIELQSAYLYSPDSAKFSPFLPPDTLRENQERLTVARDEFAREWRDSAADLTFALGVQEAGILGCAGLKVNREGPDSVSLEYVNPADLGVLREDIQGFRRQRAIVHWFSLALWELEELVRGLPDAAEIMQTAREGAIEAAPESARTTPRFMQQVVVSSVQDATTQGIAPFGSFGDAEPEVTEPLVELAEVWEQSKFTGSDGEEYWDWWVTTLFRQHVIMERRNPTLPCVPEMGLPGEHPFTLVVPIPEQDYIWGRSCIIDLWRLQNTREDRMESIDALLRRQLKPSGAVIGFPDPDSAWKNFLSEGGYAQSPMPTAKLEPYYPKFPEDAWQYIDRCDFEFGDMGGMPSTLSGSNPEGVRSAQQLGAVAQIAAGGKLRRRALFVEDCLSSAATKFFHVMQRIDDTPYPLRDKSTFLLAQIPGSVKMLVSSHSASPIFADVTIQKAKMLLEAKAIDLPTFVEMIDPPQMETLREKAVILQENQAKMAQEALEIQRAKFLKGRARKPT